MTSIAKKPAPDQLVRELHAFRHRIDKELGRPETGAVPTTMVAGGWLMFAHRLEGTLHALYETVCAERRLSPAEAWQKEMGKPYAKRMAGDFRNLFRQNWIAYMPKHPAALVLVVDIRADPSALCDAITLRNFKIHKNLPPCNLVDGEVLVRLRDLIRRAV